MLCFVNKLQPHQMNEYRAFYVKSEILILKVLALDSLRNELSKTLALSILKNSKAASANFLLMSKYLRIWAYDSLEILMIHISLGRHKRSNQTWVVIRCSISFEILLSIHREETAETASWEEKLPSEFELVLAFPFKELLVGAFHLLFNSSLKEDWIRWGRKNESLSSNSFSCFTIVVIPSLASEFIENECFKEKESLCSLSFFATHCCSSRWGDCSSSPVSWSIEYWTSILHLITY